MKREVIITGVSGFVGGNLAHHLAKNGINVIAPMRENTQPLINHQNIRTISYKESIEKNSSHQGVEMIHCASSTPVNEKNSAVLMKNNHYLDEYIVNIIKNLRPRLMTFMSSVTLRRSRGIA